MILGRTFVQLDQKNYKMGLELIQTKNVKDIFNQVNSFLRASHFQSGFVLLVPVLFVLVFGFLCRQFL